MILANWIELNLDISSYFLHLHFNYNFSSFLLLNTSFFIVDLKTTIYHTHCLLSILYYDKLNDLQSELILFSFFGRHALFDIESKQ